MHTHHIIPTLALVRRGFFQTKPRSPRICTASSVRVILPR